LTGPGEPKEPEEGGTKTLAEHMATYMDSMSQLREAANGFRAQLLADGWSPTMAEQIAGSMLAQMIARAVMGPES
jgi:hypothetical protein